MKTHQKKALIVSSFLVLSFFTIFSIAHAATLKKPFGGKIKNDVADAIVALEEEGFTCITSGSTFDITPVYGPSGPYSATVTPKGGGSPSAGKWTLGLAGTTEVPIATCTRDEEVILVSGYEITIYGVSKPYNAQVSA